MKRFWIIHLLNMHKFLIVGRNDYIDYKVSLIIFESHHSMSVIVHHWFPLVFLGWYIELNGKIEWISHTSKLNYCDANRIESTAARRPQTFRVEKLVLDDINQSHELTYFKSTILIILGRENLHPNLSTNFSLLSSARLTKRCFRPLQIRQVFSSLCTLFVEKQTFSPSLSRGCISTRFSSFPGKTFFPSSSSSSSSSTEGMFHKSFVFFSFLFFFARSGKIWLLREFLTSDNISKDNFWW